MELKDYLRNLNSDERQSYAERSGTTVGYLYLLAGKHRHPKPKLARSLHRESEGMVTLHELRPDIYEPPVFAAAEAGTHD